MTDNNEETVPQRARRMGKDYADTFHDRWSNDGRKWIKFAWTKGYQGACEDMSDGVDSALSAWEHDGNVDALVEALDDLLGLYDSRPVDSVVAA